MKLADRLCENENSPDITSAVTEELRIERSFSVFIVSDLLRSYGALTCHIDRWRPENTTLACVL